MLADISGTSAHFRNPFTTLKACEKRPVPLEDQDRIADDLEKMLHEKFEKEVPSRVIGEFIMQRLGKLDQIAYVRFASVYRDFQDEEAFFNEIRRLIKDKGRG